MGQRAFDVHIQLQAQRRLRRAIIGDAHKRQQLLRVRLLVRRRLAQHIQADDREVVGVPRVADFTGHMIAQIEVPQG